METQIALGSRLRPSHFLHLGPISLPCTDLPLHFLKVNKGVLGQRSLSYSPSASVSRLTFQASLCLDSHSAKSVPAAVVNQHRIKALLQQLPPQDCDVSLAADFHRDSALSLPPAAISLSYTTLAWYPLLFQPQPPPHRSFPASQHCCGACGHFSLGMPGQLLNPTFPALLLPQVPTPQVQPLSHSWLEASWL